MLHDAAGGRRARANVKTEPHTSSCLCVKDHLKNRCRCMCSGGGVLKCTATFRVGLSDYVQEHSKIDDGTCQPWH